MKNNPPFYSELVNLGLDVGFDMSSDRDFGHLIRSLVASKPGGRFLEIGTGIGMSTVWILDGMDPSSQLTTLDNDDQLIRLVSRYLSEDERIELICTDAANWIIENSRKEFDLVFADAWPGKYSHLEEVLSMIAPSGIYIVDDLLPQENWPEGHAEKVEQLIVYLGNRTDLLSTFIPFSSGIMICTKKNKSCTHDFNQ